MDFRNRIVGLVTETLDQLLFHPSNWKIHPSRQQAAVREALLKIGWVESVMVNVRSSEKWPVGERGVRTLVDGHMRVTLAARNGETSIPVTLVDLDPEEEEYVLITLDPLGALAETDREKLLELVAKQDQQTEGTLAALRGAGVDMRQNFSHIGETPTPTPPGGGEKPTQVYTGSESKPAASLPRDREKYPLAIVLDRADYTKWITWKAAGNYPTDSLALTGLLNKSIATLKGVDL